MYYQQDIQEAPRTCDTTLSGWDTGKQLFEYVVTYAATYLTGGS